MPSVNRAGRRPERGRGVDMGGHSFLGHGEMAQGRRQEPIISPAMAPI